MNNIAPDARLHKQYEAGPATLRLQHQIFSNPTLHLLARLNAPFDWQRPDNQPNFVYHRRLTQG